MLEQHYSPAQLAKRWGFSDDFVRELFRYEWRDEYPSPNAARLAILANEPCPIVSQDRDHTTIEGQVILTIW